MKITVFGATGVVGGALLPLLVAGHDVAAVSRSEHATEKGVRWVEGDASSVDDVARVSRAQTSSTTLSIPSADATSSARIE